MYQSWSPSSWLHIRPAWLQTPCTFLEHWSSANSPQLQHEKLLPTIALSKESTETLIQKNLFAGISFYIKIYIFQRSQSRKWRPQNLICSTKNRSFLLNLFCRSPGKRPSPACTSRGSRSSSNALTCNQLEDLQVRSVVKGRMSRHAMLELPNPSLMEQHKTETFQVLHLPADLQVFRELCFKRACRNGWTNKWSVENILLRQGLSKLFAVTETTLHKSPCSISVALL